MPAVAARLRGAATEVALGLGIEGWLHRQWRRVRPSEHRDHADLLRLLEGRVRPDWDCVDVGAYRGAILAVFVSLAPHGRHVAFEPLPAWCERLCRQFPQVDIRNAAVSDAPSSSRTFHYVRSAPAYSSLRERRGLHERHAVETIAVDVVTLDEALPDYVHPRLIKIDTEGEEEGVLRGALHTLAEHRPLVVFEFVSLRDGGAERTYEFLRALDYEVGTLRGERLSRAGFLDAVLRRTTKNFLAEPA